MQKTASSNANAQVWAAAAGLNEEAFANSRCRPAPLAAVRLSRWPPNLGAWQECSKSELLAANLSPARSRRGQAPR